MTTFNNNSHWALFATGTDLTSTERVRTSDMVTSALMANGILSGRIVAGTTAPTTDKIWLDTGTAPATAKYHNGTAWGAATFDQVFPFGDYVQKSGDTMTGTLQTASGSGAAVGLGIGAANSGFTRNADGSISLYVAGTEIVKYTSTGATFQGTTTTVNATDLAVSDNVIILNEGETGAGMSKNFGGIQIDRGSSNDAVLRWNETNDTWEIGIIGAMNPLANEFENLGTGGAVYAQTSVNKVQLRSILPDVGLKVTQNANDLTLAYDYSTLTTNAAVATTADTIAYFDASANGYRKATFANMLAAHVVPVGSI